MQYRILNKDVTRVRIVSDHKGIPFLWSGSFDVIPYEDIESYIKKAQVYDSLVQAKLVAWWNDGIVYDDKDIDFLLKWYRVQKAEVLL